MTGMMKIELRGTPSTVSRIALGTASLHHLSDPQARRRLIGAALDAGITHFDTAPYYGFGLAETTLDMLARESATVATKVGLYPPGGADQSRRAVLARKIAGRLVASLSRPVVDWSVTTARHSLTQSLRRLRRDRVDLLLLHEPDHALYDCDEWQRWLESERDRVGAFGVAGEASAILPFVAAKDPVAAVIQTRDSARNHEAAALRALGRDPQITFGHLAARAPGDNSSAVQALSQALHDRPGSVVLVSTRQESRIRELAAAGHAR